jgi:N-acetylmuramoyl-L-alanine amidase
VAATAVVLAGGASPGAAARPPVRPARAGAPAQAGADPLQTIALRPAAGAVAMRPAARSPATPGPASAPARRRPGSPRTAAMAAPPQATRPFSLVGVTWDRAAARMAGTVQVRTRAAADGHWTPWRILDADEPSAADPGPGAGPARGSTDPLWVGPSDGVEARVVAADGALRPLPAGLRLDLIDPDADRHESTQTEPAAPATTQTEPPPPATAQTEPPPPATAQTQPAPPATAPLARTGGVGPPRPAPRYVSRSGWGANEAIVRGTTAYTASVQVLFVHHTATGNDYSCADSASIVRGIQAYHVRSKGWNDIGYNFLVDKCGTLFEGRRGGVDRPVLGAHTLGFNSYSSAIAVIGNYDSRTVPAAVRTVIAEVAAYKIGAYGNNPAGSVTLTSNGSDRYPAGTRVVLHRISGHRDTGRTDCPGDDLYGQLGEIRDVAGAAPYRLAVTGMVGANRLGTLYFGRGAVKALWATRTPSALLGRFDVLVDGTLVRSVPDTFRTAVLPLGLGRHHVQVRAVHLNGRSALTGAYVLVDRTAPQLAAPAVGLRAGSLDGSVPVTLAWSAADPTGLRWLTVTRPTPVALPVAARRWLATAAPGVPTTWGLRATDRAGNTSTAASVRTVAVVSEAAAARTGPWVPLASPSFLGGAALRGAAAGSTLTWTFTGRSAALAVSRSPASGRIRIAVDGRPAGVLDLRAPTLVHRQAVWARYFGLVGRHTVQVEVEGTAGRPTVVSDGLVYLR